jgi:hypothetical protein
MRGSAVAVRMLGARVDARVSVAMPQVPWRTRLDGLTTTSTRRVPTCDDGNERLANEAVTRPLVLQTPQPLALPRGHPLIVVWTGNVHWLRNGGVNAFRRTFSGLTFRG